MVTIRDFELVTRGFLSGLADGGESVEVGRGDGLLVAVGPGDEEFIHFSCGAEADGEGEFRLGEVAAGGHDLA
ncbi:MAG: hypothetical protein RI897_1427 [Verrucomicrobiota bacterium]